MRFLRKGGAWFFGFLILWAGLSFFTNPLWGKEKKEVSPEEREILLGRRVGEQIEAKMPRCRDVRIEARLQMILQRLVRELDTPYDYEVRLLDEENPNAFALPGGLLYVHRGMVDFIRTDHEMAGLLAHEIIHVERSHGIRQAARNQRLNVLSLAVIVATGGQGAAIVLSGVAQAAVRSSYSREYEEQADREGLLLLQSAGYEPSGMVTVMERLYEEGWKHPYVDPGVYMDHPETEDRVAYLVDVMKNRGWPLHRKKPLGLLRVSWESREGAQVLLVDRSPVWSLAEGLLSPEERDALAERLEDSLEMELLPCDISLETGGECGVLSIGNRLVLSSSSPEIVTALPELRAHLVEAVNRAKQQHPMGSYF